MAVHEAPTDEECYLAAILMDESGLDLAEFSWVDELNDDAIFRAWPFQWTWWRCTDALQIDQGARSIGKSESIAVRANIFPFVHPGQEMVITAPEKVHLEAITDKIETRILASRISREMLAGGGGRNSFKHQPFHANFRNGARIMGRIPQRDGRGMKGCSRPETPILTPAGFGRADSIQPGETVWTHEGWREVTEVQHDVADLCYEVEGQGSFPITVSWDHRFFGASDEAKQPGKRKRQLGELWWGNTEDLVDDRFYWATPTKFDALEVPDPNCGRGTVHLAAEKDEFWWLVGRYLADGHLNRRSKGGGVCWTVHPSGQPDVVKRLVACGLKWWRGKRKHSTADVLTTGSCGWMDWLDQHFGSGCDKKQIPGWALGMQESHRRALLDGYLSGDGARVDARKRWQVCTASENLALGVQLLAQSLGHRCSGHHVVTPEVTQINGTALKNGPIPSFRFQIYDKGVGSAVERGGYFLSKVKAVKAVGSQPVVNIITDAHSYTSGTIVSHNTHPLWLELDEGQDYPKPGWTETIETLKRGTDGAVWRAHGVTRGVRDEFYKFTQPDSGWTVHHITAMARPNWTDDERQEKILQYNGSKEDPDYRRNVMGMHGDNTNPLFVLHRLMACVDEEATSEYNLDEYRHTRITAEIARDAPGGVLSLLDMPDEHLNRKMYPLFWVGMDVGYTTDPSEILVFGEMPQGKKDSVLKLLSRIHLSRIDNPEQVKIIMAVLEHYRPRVFAMDKTGVGLPLFQDLQAEEPDLAKLVRGYNFSEKILVGLDDTIEVDEFTGDVIKEAGIKRNVREYAQDCLRTLVDESRLLLPWDRNLIAQFQGGTSTNVSGRDQYGRRRIFSGGEDHALDAARMAAIGHAVYSIEEMVKKKDEEPVIDVFFVS